MDSGRCTVKIQHEYSKEFESGWNAAFFISFNKGLGDSCEEKWCRNQEWRLLAICCSCEL